MDARIRLSRVVNQKADVNREPRPLRAIGLEDVGFVADFAAEAGGHGEDWLGVS
jgi:hypothetical protein